MIYFFKNILFSIHSGEYCIFAIFEVNLCEMTTGQTLKQ